MKEQLKQVKEYPEGTVTVISDQWKGGCFCTDWRSPTRVFMISPGQHKHDEHNGIEWNITMKGFYRITPIMQSQISGQISIRFTNNSRYFNPHGAVSRKLAIRIELKDGQN